MQLCLLNPVVNLLSTELNLLNTVVNLLNPVLNLLNPVVAQSCRWGKGRCQPVQVVQSKQAAGDSQTTALLIYRPFILVHVLVHFLEAPTPVSGSVIDSFRLELSIASPRFASLLIYLPRILVHFLIHLQHMLLHFLAHSDFNLWSSNTFLTLFCQNWFHVINKHKKFCWQPIQKNSQIQNNLPRNSYHFHILPPKLQTKTSSLNLYTTHP